MPKKVFRDSDSDEDEFSMEDRLNDSEDEGTEDDSDSDDAPEDVSFTSSKQKALQKVRDALNQIGNEKQKLKQKRRNRDDQFREQKKLKLESLEKSKLSADVLDMLPSQPIKRAKKNEATAEENVETAEDPDSAGESDDSGCRLEDGEDFIPLSSGKEGVKAVYVMEAMKATKTSLQKTADFRQKRLYGSNIKRESAQDLRARKQKQRVRRK